MCGRYVASTSADELAQYFGVQAVDDLTLGHSANYNVAPTQNVYVVYEDAGIRCLDTFHWGLVPFWAKNPRIGNRMINARAETLATKNAFRVPLARRRCIIPADGFYEWRKVENSKRKQPMFISRSDGEPLAFAGLWEVWRDPRNVVGDEDPEPHELHSCTIITCAANETIRPVHDRMPVLIPPSDWDDWLNRDKRDVDALKELLVPAPPSLIHLHPVSTDVNNARNNGSHLITKASDEELVR